MSILQRPRARSLAAVTVLVAAFLGGTVRPGYTSPPGGRSWVAMGDSISSGYGIASVSTSPSAWGQDCARASGTNLNTTLTGLAWPVQAARVLEQENAGYQQFFTACAGNLTDDWAVQLAEAYRGIGAEVPSELVRATPGRSSSLVTALESIAASGRRFDLITATMGANNVGLGLFGQGCIDVAQPDGSAREWTSAGWGGCDADEQTVRQQVDLLTGRKPISGPDALAAGQVPLWSPDVSSGETEPMLSALAKFVNPGGKVIIVGYPQVFESPERTTLAARWSKVPGLLSAAGNCQGASVQAMTATRAAIDYLNAGIREATGKANAMFASRGVTFEYLDMNSLAMENASGRHALCTADPWINDPWTPTHALLHPNAAGHAAVGDAIARQLPR